MQDLIAALISFFLIEPLQAELADQLAAARAPQAVVAQVTSCARTATPVVVERAASDPWWAVSGAARLWAGLASPETVLLEAAPERAAAVEAARPLLIEQAA
jgi:hypothetical protein